MKRYTYHILYRICDDPYNGLITSTDNNNIFHFNTYPKYTNNVRKYTRQEDNVENLNSQNYQEETFDDHIFFLCTTLFFSDV